MKCFFGHAWGRVNGETIDVVHRKDNWPEGHYAHYPAHVERCSRCPLERVVFDDKAIKPVDRRKFEVLDA